jgi:predicted DNA-binding transcriptional regulator YafY
MAEVDGDTDGISRRQIFDDIAFMESTEGWGVELIRKRDGKRVHYRYADPNFSINNMPLNEIEINQLQSALDILAQFKGMPQFEWINELLPKLKQGMPSGSKSDKIIEFDSNQYLRGIEHLGNLHSAIFYKKVLNIKYQPFENDAPYSLILHPYFLKQYNNRWFVFGYNPDANKFDWNLALDRIVEMKEVKGKFHDNTQIKWDEYFDDIIGVTKPIDAKPESVVLHFYGRTGKYMETKPIHGSQKSKWIDKDTLEVRLQLIINYELERLILSYAESVKVIKPASLLKQVRSRQKAASKLYV